MDIIYTLHSLCKINLSELINFFNLKNNEPVHIIDNLFIGNSYNASNWAIIRDYNFKFIINTSPRQSSEEIHSPEIFRIPANELENINKMSHDEMYDPSNFKEILNFIENAQSINNIYTNKKINILVQYAGFGPMIIGQIPAESEETKFRRNSTGVQEPSTGPTLSDSDIKNAVHILVLYLKHKYNLNLIKSLKLINKKLSIIKI